MWITLGQCFWKKYLRKTKFDSPPLSFHLNLDQHFLLKMAGTHTNIFYNSDRKMYLVFVCIPAILRMTNEQIGTGSVTVEVLLSAVSLWNIFISFNASFQSLSSSLNSSMVQSKIPNVVLEGLRPGTGYVVKVKARTVAGYGAYSKEMLFQTLTDGKWVGGWSVCVSLGVLWRRENREENWEGGCETFSKSSISLWSNYIMLVCVAFKTSLVNDVLARETVFFQKYKKWYFQCVCFFCRWV